MSRSSTNDVSGGDLGRVDTGHLLDDLGETGDDLFLGGGHSDAAQ
jgi:hypothetical protein